MPAFRHRIRAIAVGVGAFALVAVAAGGTFAASNPATLYACYDVYGNVRMGDTAQCKLPGGGRLVSWGSVGPQGPTGATGAAGPTGPTGPTGPGGNPYRFVGTSFSYSLSAGDYVFGVSCLSQDLRVWLSDGLGADSAHLWTPAGTDSGPAATATLSIVPSSRLVFIGIVGTGHDTRTLQGIVKTGGTGAPCSIDVSIQNANAF
jgi:hypothetical protein